METAGEITRLLEGVREGDGEALERLFPLLYDELRRIARQRMKGERPGHTLRPTALVHEAYLRLLDSDVLRAEDRSQFFAAASETMRRILVDYARARKRLKRGGGQAPIPLDEAEAYLSEREADEMLAFDDALSRLARQDARAAEIVRYRLVAGLTLEETGQLLGVSAKTVQRSWAFARAWLRREVGSKLADRDAGEPKRPNVQISAGRSPE